MPTKSVEPFLFIAFGATGDLMKRKLLPAIHHLAKDGFLPGRYRILGVAHNSGIDDAAFRTMAREALAESGAPSSDAPAWCEECIFYHGLGEATAADYKALGDRIASIEQSASLPGNRIFYLAMPPDSFPGTISALGETGLSKSPGWARLVIEKPFGHDLASAQELNRLVHQYFDESQIYRIDHYLGKETVQNLLAFRFGNAIFESIWNRDRIERVLITVAEELGVEKRAKYYEHAGAVRDMIQNHLTQLLTLTTMEIPSAFDADAIRYEKVKVLRAISPLRPEDVIFGQYTGRNIDGKTAPGYRQEPGVAPDSTTPTYAAIRLDIDNWRWQGVPFYLRTGKRMPGRISQIEVTFRHPPVSIFHLPARDSIQHNVLTINLQPNEGFELSFEVKAPGQAITLETQRMRFRYAEAFGALADAYKTLLLDVMRGDQTLFVHADEVEYSWRLYTPLLQRSPQIHPYEAGTWGPPEAEELFDRDAEIIVSAAK